MQTTTFNDETHQRVLFVDDELPILKALKRFSRNRNWNASIVTSGREAIELLKKHDFDIVVSDMCMPGMDGAELLESVKKISPNTVRILLTGHSDVSHLEAAINRGGIFNYLSKPWNDLLLAEMLENAFEHRASQKEQENLIKVNQEQFKKLGKLALALDHQVKERSMETQQALALLENFKTRTHQEYHSVFKVLASVNQSRLIFKEDKFSFVQKLCQSLADSLLLSESEKKDLAYSSQIYRLGALCLPQEIDDQAYFQLTPENKKLFEEIPTIGAKLLAKSIGLKNASKIVLCQNENLDGSGYPNNITGERIPLSSKILRVANDFYELSQGFAIVNVYGTEQTLQFMLQNEGKVYDRNVLQHLVKLDPHSLIRPPTNITLPFDQLLIGMKLANHIKNPQGVLLLTEGTTLNRRHLEILKTLEEKEESPLYTRVKLSSVY